MDARAVLELEPVLSDQYVPIGPAQGQALRSAWHVELTWAETQRLEAVRVEAVGLDLSVGVDGDAHGTRSVALRPDR
ncbi:MAG: hypothetical protein JOZ69_01150 [Myxococcales bacterium]|nr:hypothetical protein [Myxococcales bacterium]